MLKENQVSDTKIHFKQFYIQHQMTCEILNQGTSHGMEEILILKKLRKNEK